MNFFIPNRYLTDKLFETREIMYSHSDIAAILKKRMLNYELFTLDQIEEFGGEVRNSSFSNDQKLVYVVKLTA